MIPDHISCLIQPQFDTPILSLIPSPKYTRFLCLSPISISIFSTEKSTDFLGTFSLSSSQIKEYKYFSSVVWVSEEFFACLSVVGVLLLFSVSFNGKISLKKIFTSNNGSIYTAIAAYKGFLIAGDDKGNLNFLSLESSNSINHHIHDVPFHSISTSVHHALLLFNDHSVYQIELNIELFTKETKIQYKKLNLLGYHIIANPIYEAGAISTLNDELYLTNLIILRKL